MTYRPREFWEQRLGEHFDLRGTGETGLSLAYNRACYALRRHVLDRALRDAGVRLAGARVLDVGCGTGFFTDYYLSHGAQVLGVDIAATSIDRLRVRFPQATFERVDIGETPPPGTYDVVNAFDVLYHITDDAAWERAVTHLARAVAPGGVLLLTDVFVPALAGHEAHNLARPLTRYRTILAAHDLDVLATRPTHALLNRHLGNWRWLNRFPQLLLVVDRLVLRFGGRGGPGTNVLLVARRHS